MNTAVIVVVTVLIYGGDHLTNGLKVIDVAQLMSEAIEEEFTIVI